MGLFEGLFGAGAEDTLVEGLDGVDGMDYAEVVDPTTISGIDPTYGSLEINGTLVNTLKGLPVDIAMDIKAQLEPQVQEYNDALSQPFDLPTIDTSSLDVDGYTFCPAEAGGWFGWGAKEATWVLDTPAMALAKDINDIVVEGQKIDAWAMDDTSVMTGINPIPVAPIEEVVTETIS